MLILTEQEAREITHSLPGQVLSTNPHIITIEDGHWMNKGRSDERITIVKNKKTQRYYKVVAHRTPTYFIDYYYDYEKQPIEVKPNRIETVSWDPVPIERSSR